MIITISGKPGSGKTTTAKLLAQKLKLKHYSAGDLQRELAKELKLTINELGRLEAKDDKYDHMIDKKQKNLGKTEDNFVIDGWLSALFIPKSVKIFLNIGRDEAVRRRLKQPREEERYSSHEETKQCLAEREKTNRERWLRYYDFDYASPKNYDIVIDTTNNTPEQTVQKIIGFLKKKNLLY